MCNREFIHSFENCWKHEVAKWNIFICKIEYCFVYCTILELEKLGIFLRRYICAVISLELRIMFNVYQQFSF